MRLRHQLEYVIYGATATGDRYPSISGFATDMDGLSARVKAYKQEYPDVVRVVLDVAFPMEGPNK